MSASTTQYPPTPFDKHLETGEKLLWTSVVKQPKPFVTGAKWASIMVAAWFARGIGRINASNLSIVGPPFFGVLAAFGAVIFIVLASGQWISNRFAKKSMYGITNQRLLTYTNDLFIGFALTDIPNIR